MSTATITIPTPEILRADIRSHAEKLRALRRLLKLAEAAEAVRLLQENKSHRDPQTGGST
jgi:hypothetical protein